MWILSLLLAALADTPADPQPFSVDPVVESLFRDALPAVERCREEAAARGEPATGDLVLVLSRAQDGGRAVSPDRDNAVQGPVLECALAALTAVTPPPDAPATLATYALPETGPVDLTLSRPAPIILGALDKSLIDQIIKQHMSEIRYCYQRELFHNPVLAGGLTVKFVIARDGTVSSAETKTTTLPDAAVPDCVLGRFKTFEFPEPKGGGIVIVSYPFLFAPANARVLPTSLQPELRACLADVAPLRSAELLLAVHHQRRAVDRVEVLMAATPPGDRSSCLLPLASTLPGKRGWSLYSLPRVEGG